MSESTASANGTGALQAQIADLGQLVEEQGALIGSKQREQAQPGSPAGCFDSGGCGSAGEPVNRRALLRKAGAAAVGAVVGGVSLASGAQPAAAHPGHDYGADLHGDRAALYLRPNTGYPANITGGHLAGELYVWAPANGRTELWWSAIADATGTQFRRLAGPDTIGALSLWGAPRRAYDSRPEHFPGGVEKGALATGGSRLIDISTAGAMPNDAAGSFVNLTITATVGGGFLRVYANGAPPPLSSSINWYTNGQTLANTFPTRVSKVGGLSSSSMLRVDAGGAGSVHFVVDVIGYFI